MNKSGYNLSKYAEYVTISIVLWEGAIPLIICVGLILNRNKTEAVRYQNKLLQQ